ncbi:adenylate/guanylate cyclase domain-containing protein [Fulvivirgaceae bacterium BMA10]|uniref:Adenylate/guanylate cyclase domain-containing protein n=1 Tax=Splendidivirga corallicola TaxID=3051826 RepID=A0ABT8KX06_9BACT|nr:adenylate/guanylate cyclase domain-containing protein [Fulvivirgaceae bacterium BMA10]
MRLSKLKLNRLLFNILFWSFVFAFVLGIRYYDIGNIAFIQLPVEIPSYRIFVNGIILGLLVGVFYTVVENRLDSIGIYNNSLGRIILLRTFYLFVVSGTALAFAAYLNYLFDAYKGTITAGETGYGRYIFSTTVKFLFLAALVGNFTLSIFYTLKSKIGSTEFNNLLMGLYRSPKEEFRAFMFLDLKSSTTIAESLGHRKYSQLIQSCFRDLTEAILETEAEVYQYVGDEVVLSWSGDSALRNANCVKIYFEFCKKLESKRDYYEREYGALPLFKAGVNMGTVTVVEVGVLKRAIVYHSDVLNTAARIQSLCNQYGQVLLVSEEIRNGLNNSGYSFNFIGDVLLRGKSVSVNIYSCEKH